MVMPLFIYSPRFTDVLVERGVRGRELGKVVGVHVLVEFVDFLGSPVQASVPSKVVLFVLSGMDLFTAIGNSVGSLLVQKAFRTVVGENGDKCLT